MKILYIAINTIILWVIILLFLVIIPLPIVFKQNNLKNTLVKYQTYSRIQKSVSQKWVDSVSQNLAPHTLYGQIVKENANELLSLDLVTNNVNSLLDQVYLGIKYLKFDNFGNIEIKSLKEKYLDILKTKNLSQDLPHLTAIIPSQINIFEISNVNIDSIKNEIKQIHNLYQYFYLIPIALGFIFSLAWFGLFSFTDFKQSGDILVKITLSVGIFLLIFPFIWQFVILGPIGTKYIQNLNLQIDQSFELLIVFDLLKQIILFWAYEAILIVILSSLILLKKRL